MGSLYHPWFAKCFFTHAQNVKQTGWVVFFFVTDEGSEWLCDFPKMQSKSMAEDPGPWTAF